VASDAHEVARDAVVLGAHALVGKQRELRAAEDLLAAVVQRLGLRRELGSLLEEATTNDVVAPALERRAFTLRARGRYAEARSPCVREVVASAA